MDHRAEARPELAAIFREQIGFVWRSLRSFGVPEDDLEDAAQEVFIVVQKRLGTWDGQKLREWLFSIAQRVASNHRKRLHVRRSHAARVEQTGAPRPPHSGVSSLEARETLRNLEAALADLDEDKRTVFVLYEVEQLTMSEIASVVNVPLKTAYARLYAARSFVAKRMGLGEAPEEEEP
jgi:RNA polymerase sigma-70 factor (ECF subfamily)